MAGLRNPRHERFAREFIKSGVASKAYKSAYPTVSVGNSCWVNASRLLRHPKVKRRIEALQEQYMKRANITVEKILTDYQWALDMAKEGGKAGDVVMAAKEQARLVGLLVERRELGQVGDFDSLTDPQDVIAKVALEIGQDAANALGKAFGLVEAVPVEPSVLGKVIPWPSGDDTIN